MRVKIELLMAGIMRILVFWLVTPCRSQRAKLDAYFCWFPGLFTHRPWRWRRYVPPKCRTPSKLHRVTTQETTLFIFIFWDVTPYSLTDNLLTYWISVEVCGGVVEWDTVRQAGRSRVRFPMTSLDFYSDPILPGAMALGSTQPLTEMSSRNLPGGKGRPGRKADNLTAICELTV
jgi:hypothetical protein